MGDEYKKDKPLFSKEVRDVFEHSSIPLAVYYVNNGRFMTYLVSDAFCKMYGTTHEELVGRLNSPDPFVNIPDDEEKRLWEVVKNFSGKDAPFNAVFHEYVPNLNETITVHANGAHQFTPDGRRYSVVTYEKITEESLQLLFVDETKEELSILDGLTMDCLSIWIVDGKNQNIKLIQNHNGKKNMISNGILNGFKKLGDYQNGLDYYINTYVYPEDRERVHELLSFEHFSKVLQTKKVFTLRFRQQYKDYPLLHIQMSITYGQNGSTGNYIIAVRDVTGTVKEEIEEQQKLQEALDKAEAASRAKSTFLFNVSHDIRTPLNAIIGFAELAEKHSDNPARQKDCQNKIKSTSYQLLDILNNVLEMARIESGKYVIDTQLTYCPEFFEKWTTMFTRETHDKNISISVNYKIEHPYLFLDQVHITEILMNILSNAVKYTAPGGSIFISTTEYPGNEPGTCLVKTVIKDTGIGISKDFLPHIYDDFERERTTSTSSISGTGLGLSIVKKLVDLMNGTIDIESEIGVGTTVTITLPHKIGEAPSATISEPIEDLSHFFYGKHILLAEDNDLNAEIAMEILADVGFEVDRASDGVNCVDMVKSKPAGTYDLILMDIQMPNMNGYKAANYIRNLPDPKLSGIPIIAMTANAFKEDVDNALESGMNGHIAKPIEVRSMLNTIYHILQNK
jgi:signal transduction histidine kinase